MYPSAPAENPRGKTAPALSFLNPQVPPELVSEQGGNRIMSPWIPVSFRRFSPVFLVVIGVFFLTLPAQAAPVTGVVVYSTGFSTDPGWSTNNPATNYVDAEKGMFHYFMRDGSGAYVNVKVPYSGESFTLSFDILPERTDYQAKVKFGLGDNDQVTQERLTMFTELENGPYGRIIWIRSIDLQNQRREASSYYLSYGGPTVQFQDGVWYHVDMDYRTETRSLSLSVYRRNDSSPVWHYTLDAVSVFPTMDRIYLSKIGDSTNPNAIAEGYIDNVAFSLHFPAETPGTVSTENPATPAASPAVTTGSTQVPEKQAEPIPLSLPVILAALAVILFCVGRARARNR
jgi:hypothetical protein